MSAWKSYGKMTLCGLFFLGCSDMGIPLPFVEQERETTEFDVRAKVRDFKEGNATDNEGTHPHFNQTRWICEAKAMGPTVEDALATDGASDDGFPGDNRNPRLLSSMPGELSRCFEPIDRFGDWFDDKSDDVNRPYLVTLKFEKDGSGYFRYRNDKFFPLDNGSAFSKAKSGVPDPFGHLQSGSKDEVDLAQHNYGFTLEFHTRFKYEAGKGHIIAVEGDDDLWVFINDQRALDLGGTHPAQRDTIYLDELGLINGTTYPLDFFFAERSVASSKLTIATNVILSPAQ